MCNINIFITTEENKTEEKINDFLSFFNCSLCNSFISNNDGEGFYFDYDNLLLKSDNKINILNYVNQIKRSKFIITHQRLSTSGKTKEYHHPFMNDDFVMVHNGVMNEFKEGFEEKDKISDSYAFFEVLNREIKKNPLFAYKNKTLRSKIIVTAIKNLLKNASGWYSIGLYDIKTKKLYYFKDNFTRMNLYRNGNKTEVFLTTEENNLNFLDFYDSSFKKIELKPYSIYSISINETKKVIIEEIEKIPVSLFNSYSKNSKKKDKKSKKQKKYISGYGGYYDYYDYEEETPLYPLYPKGNHYNNGYFTYSKLSQENLNKFYCALCKNEKASIFDGGLNMYLCDNCFKTEYAGII